MDSHDLQTYLSDRIPLSRAMEVRVVAASEEGVSLAAPLAPNINHRDTVFGGSAAAVAMLSAWGLLQLRLEAAGMPSRVVIHRNEMTFERPIVTDFTAAATIPETDAWPRLVAALHRKGRGRVRVRVELECQDERVAVFQGDFVAVSSTSPTPGYRGSTS
jgi:thioesterase domain-containing protein